MGEMINCGDLPAVPLPEKLLTEGGGGGGEESMEVIQAGEAAQAAVGDGGGACTMPTRTPAVALAWGGQALPCQQHQHQHHPKPLHHK